jgi:O-antigen ligase
MVDSNRLTPVTLSFWLLALSVALLPIGLGGNRPIPFGLAQLGLAASGFLLLLDKRIWKETFFSRRIRLSLVLFFAVFTWAWLQTQSFMPAGWAHPLWQEAAGVLKKPVAASIAISPEDSLHALTRLITYLACGLLAYILGQNPGRAKQLLEILWLSAGAVCVYGLAVYLLGNDSILWFKKWSYEEDLTATFVNRNHFAIYAGMGLVTGAALLMQSWRDDIEKRRKGEVGKAVRSWLGKKGLPRLFLLALMLTCVLLSHSRAGLVLTVLGFGGYLFFHQIYIKSYRWAAAVGVLAVLALILVFVAAGQYSERFATLFSDYSSRDRLRVYEIIWKAVQINPFLGYGLDGFQSIFRLYQPGMVMEFNRGHSDILESLLDLGIVGGLVLWAAVVLLITGLFHGIFRRRRYGLFPALGLAISAMAILHGAVDFSLQIPGVVFMWATLMGTGLAQSWRENEKETALEKKGKPG